MRSLIAKIPYAYKPFCPKSKDEYAIIDMIYSSKKLSLIREIFVGMDEKKVEQKMAIIYSDVIGPSEEQIEGFQALSDVRLLEQLKPNLFDLSKDLFTAYQVIYEIFYYCCKNDFPIPAFFRVWTIMIIENLEYLHTIKEGHTDVMVEKVIGYANDGITSIVIDIPINNELELYLLFAENFFKAAGSCPIPEFNDCTQDYQCMIIENTFKSARNSFEENFKKLEIHKIIMGIEHYPKSDTSLYEELENDKDIFVEAFTNNRSYSKLQKGDHYLRAIKNCKTKFSDNLGYTVVAEELEKGLIVGYTSKYLSLLIKNKRTVAAELKRNLAVLKKYKNSTNTEIEFTEKLISFVEQTRYVDYYPYKAIAEYTGMKKNEVKNLCKKIFFSDRNKAIESSFDNLILIKP